jgi:inner membrane protein
LDNLTHSLLGAALAEVALPPGAPRPVRRLYYVAAVAAANLPDLDLLYTRVTPSPLGYLLHHRGHTHTLVGLAAQAVLFGLLCRLLGPARRLASSGRLRLWILIAAGLLSHILLDAGNSYGVHPFYPFDARWSYGDAVFIFEPWLWLLLGLPVVWTASRRATGVALIALVALLTVGLALSGVVPGGAVAALVLAAVVYGFALARLRPPGHAFAALGASVLFVAVLFGLSRAARREATALLAAVVQGEILDVVLTPDPANPVCWSLIVVERGGDGREYVLRAATLSLLPAWLPPATCASHRYGGPRPYRDLGGRLAVYEAVRQPLEALRDLERRDCWVRAWLQFGRAPMVRSDEILDLRFERGGDNFTAMRLQSPLEAARCPPHLTSWEPPRADLLGRRAE